LQISKFGEWIKNKKVIREDYVLQKYRKEEQKIKSGGE
jgi:hypothetical protein